MTLLIMIMFVLLNNLFKRSNRIVIVQKNFLKKVNIIKFLLRKSNRIVLVNIQKNFLRKVNIIKFLLLYKMVADNTQGLKERSLRRNKGYCHNYNDLWDMLVFLRYSYLRIMDPVFSLMKCFLCLNCEEGI